MSAFIYSEPVHSDYLRLRRENGSLVVGLDEKVSAWVESQCSGRAILETAHDDYLIVFDNPADAVLFRINFAR